jgi:Na+/H+ antiporter NhaD/arsenite permease-like protein
MSVAISSIALKCRKANQSYCTQIGQYFFSRCISGFFHTCLFLPLIGCAAAEIHTDFSISQTSLSELDEHLAIISWIPVVVLVVVFVMIAVRKIGQIRIKIWQAMTLGAIAVLLMGQISPLDALYSVNIDVMLFLFGMFVVGETMQKSGYLNTLSFRLFHRAKNVNNLVLLILFPIGLLSAILMNDTLAIIGTPVVLSISKKQNISPKLLLLTLAVAVTTGSVLSPIGNPQNLLIASSGLTNPFLTFLFYLFMPTLVSLGIAYVVLRVIYRKQFVSELLPENFDSTSNNDGLIRLAKIALALLLILIVLKILIGVLTPWIDLRLSYIALLASFPILLLSRERANIVKNIDWATLVFFASMFVLMASVWQSGFFQELLAGLDFDVTSVPAVMVIGILFSQLISNVPLVALYLPLLTISGITAIQMMALAAGSTIAGNMLILGAASNVIIIQNAEKQGETLTFLEFARVGAPLVLLQAIVYLLFLGILL